MRLQLVLDKYNKYYRDMERLILIERGLDKKLTEELDRVIKDSYERAQSINLDGLRTVLIYSILGRLIKEADNHVYRIKDSVITDYGIQIGDGVIKVNLLGTRLELVFESDEYIENINSFKTDYNLSGFVSLQLFYSKETRQVLVMIPGTEAGLQPKLEQVLLYLFFKRRIDMEEII